MFEYQPATPGSLFPSRASREAALFAAAVALLIDAMFYVSLADAQLGGGPLAVWSAFKVFAIAGLVGWIAVENRAWSLGLVALIFLLVGLEDSFGVTAPLGLWLLHESGIRRGPHGTNKQLLRRGFIMVSLLGPTLYLAQRAPMALRKALWTLIFFLGVVFLFAVFGDVIADRTGTNLDEVAEDPIYSLCLAFCIGLAVRWWPQSRLSNPTRVQHPQ